MTNWYFVLFPKYRTPEQKSRMFLASQWNKFAVIEWLVLMGGGNYATNLFEKYNCVMKNLIKETLL